ncbi:3-oxo-5-alpha-steroid 4-dehydrogenase 1 [Plakobranchus ocellatus]|uniref:3-oxo-5alpha-steroid 4-dehydrogenase (NADP(+)) n=1 Tax=Plakobranchus ocellatus TaxID=259542 RepID=A0AAV4B174_9GAST|nr:3-oxo-5-alpha-steroid 4-dehydrogenase 1 [Plakobranchus ocellatus]
MGMDTFQKVKPTLAFRSKTFIFPLLIRGGKPTPMLPFTLAFIFCGMNGFLQGGYILKYADFSSASPVRIVAGIAVFFTGMLINIHSDHVLRNLRKPGETTYKIPYGGMFNYVSGANFLGEIIEWTGFTILNWTFPTVIFAFFTVTNIGPRAVHHHTWYKEKFDDYPKNRKALIPFIL